jgi:DNA-binding CsgD family transcriptional regulator
MRLSTLSILERVFKAQGGVFLIANEEMSRLATDNIVSLNVVESAIDKYNNYFWHYDPIYHVALHSRKVVFRNNDILPYSDWAKLKYYNDFLQPINIYRELAICLRMGTRILGQISLFRPRSQSNFSESDILKANLIASSIATGLRNAVLFTKAIKERHLLSELSEFLFDGVIILDYELNPVYISPEAKGMFPYLLHKHSGQVCEVESENRSIPSVILDNCSAIKRVPQSIRRVVHFQHEITTDEKQDNGILSIGISRFPTRYHVACVPYFLVSMKYVSGTYDSREELTEGKCFLTKREMDIAMCVGEGLTNRQISQKLFISEFTVATHLRNIFEKTRVRNRTELANYIMQSRMLRYVCSQRGLLASGQD